MLAVLLGLGTWQVERLHWKRRCWLRSRAPRPRRPCRCRPTRDPFTKVQVTGQLRDDLSASYGAEVRDTPAGRSWAPS